MNSKSKREILGDFIESFKDLPEQRSKKWLENRILTIGGSEMSTITGDNPYKNIRGLIESHIGMTEFKGNINTYWGTILEDLVVKIMEDKWGARIYETGSLPGAVEYQTYSPDGLIYLEKIDKIALLEIKSASRRIANGKVPKMYKPQIYTGLDTIRIADMAIFIDALFRKCTMSELEFSESYDTEFHPNKFLGMPLSLCCICIYEESYSSNYDSLKKIYGKEKSESIDLGSCEINDLEEVLKRVANKELRFYMPNYINKPDEPVAKMFNEFNEFILKNNYDPIAILPIKLFKLDLIEVQRDDWKKKYNRKTRQWEHPPGDNNLTYVEQYKDTIKNTIETVRRLYGLPENEQMEELNILFPAKKLELTNSDSVIESLLF